MHKLFLTILFIMLSAAGLWRCSEPTAPITPPPKLEPPKDSTSHAYTWEYFVLGKFGSTLSAVAADSDTNVWAVGDVELGYEIPTTPGGRMMNKANAFHITPRGIEPFAIELMQWESPSYVALGGVTLEDGLPTFWRGLSRTKMTKDTLSFHFFRELNGLILGQQYYKSGTDGHIYLYGGSGFLARIIGPKHERFVQIPTGTSKTLKSFTQVGPNEFYIGGWNHDSTGGIFHHLKDGQVTAMTRRITEDIALGQAMAMWSSPDRLHAYCPPFFYMQSLTNPEIWDAIHGRKALHVESYGAIICAAGRADNDVFYAGHYGTVIHYNGRSLHLYDEIPVRLPNGMVFYDIAVSTKHVFIAGSMNNYAILVKGTRVAQ